MITTCTECQARYQLDAEKIPPRVIKVRCPSCEGVFSLDGNLAKDQARQEKAQPQEEALTIQRGFGEFSPPGTNERPAAEVQVPVRPEPQHAPDPTSASSAESPASEPATGVAVIDPPAESRSRRRRSKEEMLARALVSDIMVYNRDLYDRAKAEGNLLEALSAEIKKSWELYKDKVTPEVANSSNHFRDALNEILADGENIF